MSKKLGLWVALCFSLHVASTQMLKVVSGETNRPIPDVFVYHENQINQSVTDAEGLADISDFPKAGRILFQHPGFRTINLSMQEAIGQTIVALPVRVVQFDDVVVSANRWEQQEKDLSQQIVSISSKQIEQNLPTTSADLLAQSGEVFVQKSQLGGGSPKLRGFSANAVLLVIDNVRMNNAIYRSGNLQNILNIDPLSVERAEVVFGPGSVIYGSDALGGVMDFHTTDPSFTPMEELEVEANGYLKYASAAEERTAHVDASFRSHRFTYYGSFTQTIQQDLLAGSWRTSKYAGFFERSNYAARENDQDVLLENQNTDLQVGSGYDLQHTLHKFKWKPNRYTQLMYAFHYSSTSDVPRYDRLVINRPGSDSLQHAEWYYGPQTWRMHTLQVSNHAPRTWSNQWRITAAWQNYTESRNDRTFGDDELRTRTEWVDVYSINADINKKTNQGEWFYGLEFNRNVVDSEGFRQNILSGLRTPTAARYPTGGSFYYTNAAYVNWVHRFNRRWLINLGGRYSLVRLVAREDNASPQLNRFETLALNNQAINGLAGVVHQPEPGIKLGLTLSSGFRAPNIDDVGKVFEFDRDGRGEPLLTVPNSNLRPEYTYSQEFSYAQEVGSWKLYAVAFNTWLLDPIIRGPFQLNGANTLFLDEDEDPLTPDVEYTLRAQINGDLAHLYGASAGITYQKDDWWHIKGAVSYSYGEERSTREPLRHTTPVFGQLGGYLEKNEWVGQFYIQFSGNRWRNQIPTTEIDDKPYLYTDEGSPGWFTLNAKGSYRYEIDDWPVVYTFTAGVENMLDMHYRPYTSGISAPGRNFIVSVRVTY